MAIQALLHIKDFDTIKQLTIRIELKDGTSMESYRSMYRWKKYTKEEWCFREVNSVMRNNPYDDSRPSIGQPNLDISNIKSVKVTAES